LRAIEYSHLVTHVKEMCLEANCILPKDINDALERAQQQEESPLGQSVLGSVLENAHIAKTKTMPLCQDTGLVVVFADVGQDVHISGGLLTDAINEGVRQAYKDYYFRKSVVADPIERENTKDNTPAVVHVSLVEGDQLRLLLAPKGFWK